MRTSLATAAVGLFTATGCNQFFGLEDTHPIDAKRPEPIPFASLLYAVPTTMTLPGGLGEPTGVTFVPIPAADVSVRVGPVDGPLEAALYNDTGAVSVPDALITAPWRLEYTLGGIVYELLWKPDRDIGRVVVPVFGGFGRPALPAGVGYAITPTRAAPPAAPTSVAQGRAFTTGVWASIDIGAAAAPIPVSLDRIAPRIGGVGKPDASRGDHVLLVDYQDVAGCTLAKGIGAAPAPDPTAAAIAVAMPWAFTQDSVAYFSYLDDTFNGASFRLVSALAGHVGADETFTSYGYTAELTMAAFVTDAGGALPAPPLVELARCTGVPASTPQPPMPVFADPIALDAYPRAAHLRIVNSRASSANGPQLVSGLSAVALSPTDSTPATSLALDLRMPFARTPMLAGAATLDLDAADQAPFATGDGAVTLTFALDEGLADMANYLEVTLYRVVNDANPAARRLVAERVYTNTDVGSPRTVLDASAFVKGAEYVFALRAYNGRPAARTGDFTQTRNPQTVTTIFTRTFVAQ